MRLRSYFSVNVSKYNNSFDFEVVRPASLNFPKDNAVMFMCNEYMQYIDAFKKCKNCLVFYPKSESVPVNMDKLHVFIKCDNPRREYSKFYSDNNITYYPELEETNFVKGAFISPKAKIGNNCKIFPGVYIGGEVTIGDNVYVGSGAKLVGEICIGDNVIIRENAVLGADGLSTERDGHGHAITMPQFGGVIIEDDVQIGAMTVIARGAIDYTVISRGSKIDNSCFISHNAQIGDDTFIVGETIMFGSSSTGKRAYISGNTCIRDGIHIGEDALVGMGSVVVKDIPSGLTVKGNPAK